jgi:hypothetical protein
MTIQSDAKRLAEVNRRGDLIRQTTKAVSAEIRVLVDKLMSDYPGHNKTIRRCLEGEAQRLLANAEVAKREKAEKAYAKEAAAKLKAANAAKRKKKAK